MNEEREKNTKQSKKKEKNKNKSSKTQNNPNLHNISIPCHITTPETIETSYVHNVYSAIAHHFSATRQKVGSNPKKKLINIAMANY